MEHRELPAELAAIGSAAARGGTPASGRIAPTGAGSEIWWRLRVVFDAKGGDAATNRIRQIKHQRDVFIVDQDLVGRLAVLLEPFHHQAIGIGWLPKISVTIVRNSGFRIAPLRYHGGR